jgi:hypothetical protein
MPECRTQRPLSSRPIGPARCSRPRPRRPTAPKRCHLRAKASRTCGSSPPWDDATTTTSVNAPLVTRPFTPLHQVLGHSPRTSLTRSKRHVDVRPPRNRGARTKRGLSVKPAESVFRLFEARTLQQICRSTTRPLRFSISACAEYLQERGVIVRMPLPTSPPSAEYALTGLGRELLPALAALVGVALKLPPVAGRTRRPRSV